MTSHVTGVGLRMYVTIIVLANFRIIPRLKILCSLVFKTGVIKKPMVYHED